MSFSNIQDDGAWVQGGTYTFDWTPESSIVGNADDHYTGYTLLTDGCTYWNGIGIGTPPEDVNVYGKTLPPSISSLGEILFSTDSETTAAPDPGVEIGDLIDAGLAVVTGIEDVNLDGSLYRFTVVLSADIPTGTYYLKAANYDYHTLPG